jgi:PilZ domain
VDFIFDILFLIRRFVCMEQRKAHRVVFEKGFTANMMAIDGTWRRPCTMMDVSDTGARLSIDGSIEDLAMAEFFLVLSSMGKAYRRCQLTWVNGNQVGVHFLKAGEKKKNSESGK